MAAATAGAFSALDRAASAASNDNDYVIGDLFAGGGGASEALLAATGRHPDFAVNHDREAIGMHEVNHPSTRHYCDDIRKVDPLEVMSHFPGRPVGILWASPDCKDHSKAKGGKPKDKNIRGLAWEVCRWSAGIKRATGRLPAIVALENVEEFQDWGPVHRYGKRAGTVMRGRRKETFLLWVQNLRDMGFHAIEWRELVAADYGAPTTRKRLFLIARSDGGAISWPKPTHGKGARFEGLFAGLDELGGMRPWKTAGDDVIDWSIYVPSIFDRDRPLKPKTHARIAKGIKRHVITAGKPFIVPVTHMSAGPRVHSSDDPLRTMTTSKGGEFAVAAPALMPLTHGGSEDRSYRLDGSTPTITAAPRGELGIFAPFLSSVAYGDNRPGAGLRAWPVQGTLKTLTASGGDVLAGAFLVPRYGERESQEPRSRAVDVAAPTVVPKGNGGDLATIFLVRTDFVNTRAGCVYTADDAVRTATSQGGLGVAHIALSPFAAGYADVARSTAQTERQAGVFMGKMSENGVGYLPTEPLHTAMAGAPRHYQVAAVLDRQFGSAVGGRSLLAPHPAVMTDGGGGKSKLVEATLSYIGRQFGRSVGNDAGDPIGSLTAGGGGKTQVVTARAAPILDKYYGTGVAQSADRALDAVTAKGRFGMSVAFVEQANTGMVGRTPEDPISTIVGKGCTQRLINAQLEQIGAPLGSKRRAVLAFLWEHFGVPTDAQWADPLATEEGRVRFGLVVLDGVVWQIVDIGMRMLVPRELYRAQGFRDDYIIDRTSAGAKITKTGQTRMAGNSVSPPPATALLAANPPRIDVLRAAA